MEEINEASREGESANNWVPGVWSNTPNTEEDEWQPDIEPPHINDYAAFKKHKHYGKYFRAYRYTPFPAWVYHKTLEPKLVKSKEEVLALGPEWSPTPNKPRVDMTGKSIPAKSETQKLAEVVAQAAATKGGALDPTAIAGIVAAVMSAMGQTKPDENPAAPEAMKAEVAKAPNADEAIEKAALLELAEKNGVKIDKRWSNTRIREALGL